MDRTAFTPTKLSERWGCSHSHVLTLIARSELHAINIASDPAKKSKWIIPAGSVLAFEEARTAEQLMPDVGESPKRRRQRVKPGDVIEFFS